MHASSHLTNAGQMFARGAVKRSVLKRIFGGLAVFGLASGVAQGQTPTDSSWNLTGSGDWNSAGSWVGGIPGADPGNVVLFNNNITGTATVNLGTTDVRVGYMAIGDVSPLGTSNSSFIIGNGSAGRLVFSNGSSPAVLEKRWGTHVNPISGSNFTINGTDSDRIDAGVLLESDLIINTSMGLELRGAWDGGGNDITVNLPGASNSNSTKLFLNFNRANGTQMTNVANFNINGYGEVRVSGTNNVFGASNITVGGGVVAPNAASNQRTRALMRFERTDTTQTSNITLNAGHLISTAGGTNANQSFSGTLTIQGDQNWLQIGNAGSDRITSFTGNLVGAADSKVTRFDGGQMRLEGNGSNFLGELVIARDGPSDQIAAVSLRGANGTLNGAGSEVTMERGGTLFIDDSIAANNNRLADDGAINFNSTGRSNKSQVRYIGNAAGSSETFGSFNFQSGTAAFATIGTGGIDLTLNSLTIAEKAVANFSVYGFGQTFGSGTGANNTRIKLNNITTGTGPGQLSNGIVVGAFGGAQRYNLTGGSSENEWAWLNRDLMTVDSNGYLRPMTDADYDNKTIAAPTNAFTEDLRLTNNGALASPSVAFVDATENVRLTGGFGYDSYALASQASQTRWESAYLVKEDLTMNSLTFAQNHNATSSVPGDITSNDRDGNRMVLDISPGATLTLTSGMLNFASTGTYNSDSGNLDMHNFVRGGTIQAGGNGDLYINNNSLWHRTSNNSVTSAYGEAHIDSVIAGRHVIKTGAGTVYLSAANTFNGDLVVNQGNITLRDNLAVQNASSVQIHGYGTFGLQTGINIRNGPDIIVNSLAGSTRALFSNGNANTYDGDIIMKNVDSAGFSIHSGRVAANTNSILTLYGNIYSDSTNMNTDSVHNNSQLVSTYDSGGGIINLRGRFMDSATGALTGTFDDNNQRNQATRFQVGGNNDLNVQVYNPWEARGRIFLEQGWLRLMPTVDGTFWAAGITPSSNIGNAGFQMGGGGATSNQTAALMLTKDGQAFNMNSWNVGGDSTNQTGQIIMGGENTSGTVTFGTGNGVITLNNRSTPGDPAANSGGSVVRTYNRDLRMHAVSGGAVNIDARVNDGGSNVNSSITKSGGGRVNLRGATGGSSTVENLNVMDGTLALDFSVNNNTGTNNSRMSATNSVSEVRIVNGGSGYSVGNLITVSGGGGTDFRARVTSVGAGGVITGIVIENGGQGYNANITGTTFAQGSSSAVAGTGAQLQYVYGAPLKMGGGKLELVGNADADSVQSIAGLGVLSGASEIEVISQAGRAATLNLGQNATGWTNSISQIRRDSGGTLNFVRSGAGTSTINVLGSNIPTGILGPWATVGNQSGRATDFAEVVGGQVQAFTGYVGTFGAGNHTNITSDQALAGPTVTGTMRFNDGVARNIDLGGNLLSLDQAAVLMGSDQSQNVNFTNGSITSTWQSASGLNDLILHQFGAGVLDIDAAIVNDTANGRAVRLVTSGSGVIDLSGNAAGNSYTGGTVINDSTLIVNQENQLGATPGSVTNNSIWFHGGTLSSTANMTLSANRGIMVGGGGGATFDVVGNTQLTVQGNIVSEGNVIPTYTTVNEIFGDVTKTGTGTLFLTSGTNNDSWGGGLDIQEGTVRFLTNADNVLGTSRNFLDGTTVRTGGTLWLDTPSNDQYIYEWLTLDGGTLKTELTGGNWQFNYGGNVRVLSDSTIEVAQSDNLLLNRGGGALEGSGTIYKTGKGTLAMFENNVDFTGQLVIREGSVHTRSQGDAFGTADGTPGSKGQEIILGNSGMVDTTNNGEVNLAMHMNAGSISSGFWNSSDRTALAYQVGASDEAAHADAYTYDMYINNDIRVVNEGIGSTSQQNKRLRIFYPNYNGQQFSINGDIILEDDLVMYMTQADYQTLSSGTRAHTDINGSITGSRNLSLSLEQWQEVSAAQSGTTPDNSFYAIYKAFGDNQDYTGVLNISAPSVQANGGDLRTYFRPMNASALPQRWNLGVNGYIDLRDAIAGPVEKLTITNASGSGNYFNNNQVLLNSVNAAKGLTFEFDQLTSQTVSAVVRDFVQTAQGAYDTWDRTDNPDPIAAIASTRTNIIKDGPAILALNQANTHTGFTQVNNGILRMDHVDALGAASATDKWTHTYVGTSYNPETDTISINSSATGAIDLSSRDMRQSGAAAGSSDAGDREVIHVAGGGLKDANGRSLGTIINSSGTTSYAPIVEVHGDTVFGGHGRWEFRTLTGAAATTVGGADQSVALKGNGYNITKVGNNDLVFINTKMEGINKFRIEEGELRIESSSSTEPTGTLLTGIGSLELQYAGPTMDVNHRGYELVPGMGENYRPIVGARLEFYRQGIVHTTPIAMLGSSYASGGNAVHGTGYSADFMGLAGRQSYTQQSGLNEGSSNLEFRNGSTETNQFTLASNISLTGDARLNRIRISEGQSTSGAFAGNSMNLTGVMSGTGGFSTIGDRTLFLSGANTFTGDTVVTRDIRSQGNITDNANFAEIVSLNVKGANGSLGGTNALVVERSGVVFFDDRDGINSNVGGRFNDSGDFNMNRGVIAFKANASADTYEKIGMLNIQSGDNWIDMDSRNVTNIGIGSTYNGSGGSITLEFDGYTRAAGSAVHFRSLDPTKAGTVLVNNIDQTYLSGADAVGQKNTQIVIGAFGGQMDDRFVWNGRSFTGSNIFLSTDKVQNRMNTALGGALMTWDSDSKQMRVLNANEYFTMGQTTTTNFTSNSEAIEVPTTIVTEQMANDMQGSNLLVQTHFTRLDSSGFMNQDLSVNAIEFRPERFVTDANTNSQSTRFALLNDTALTIESGVITFNGKGVGGAGFSGTDANHNISVTSLIQGGYLDFGSKEAILNNTSAYLRTGNGTSGTGNDDNSRIGADGIIRSVMRGTGGLTKVGNDGIVLDARSELTGVVNIAQGTLSARHSGALGGMTQVNVMGAGSFYIGSGFYDKSMQRNIVAMEGNQYSYNVLRTRDGNGYWYGNVIDNNVDSSGVRLGEVRFGVDGERSLVIDGNLYGGDKAISEDVYAVSPRIFTTNGSDRGIIDILGQVRDNENGAVQGRVSDWETGYYEGTTYRSNGNTSGNVAIVNQNQVQRLQIAVADNNQNRIYNDLTVNMHQQYNAAGRLLMERGILRYMGEGNFWSDDAFEAIHLLEWGDNSQNGNTGFQLGGSSANGTSAASVLLTEGGQNFNIRNFSIQMNGTSTQNQNGYNGLVQSNYLIGGENTSGTVTYGTGMMEAANANRSSIIFGNSSVQRELTMHANRGGRVEIHSRIQDDGTNVTNYITKTGLGTVALMGSRTGDSQIENLTVRGGLLELSNYDRWQNRRIGDVARATNVTMGGGMLSMIGGSTVNRTEDAAGAITFRSGGSTIAVTSNFTGATTLNLGLGTTAFTRNTGATLHFIEQANAGTASINLKGTEAPAANSLIGWSVYGTSTDSASSSFATDFASLDASGNVITFARSGADSLTDLATTAAGANLRESGAFTGVLGQDVNSVLFATSGDSTLNAGAGTRTITSGGVMVASGVTGQKTITGGTIQAGTGNDIMFHNYGTGGLRIESIIAGTNAVFNGGKNSVTTLTAANTYTGNTYINGGQLVISDTNQLGATANTTLFMNGGGLRSTADMTMARNLMIGGNGSRITTDAATTFRLTGTLQSEEHYLKALGYTDNLYFGDVVKDGEGTLILTRQARNLSGNETTDDAGATFDGAMIVEQGTLRIEAQTDAGAGIANDQQITVLGSNRGFMDGTHIKSGATLEFANVSGNGGGTGVLYSREWFTFDGGSTLRVATDSRNDLRLDGVINLTGGDVTIDNTNRLLRFNLNGGHIQGEGNILKRGSGTLELRGSSALWTGVAKVEQGTLMMFSQGAALGTGTGTHIIGQENSSGTDTVQMQFRSPDQDRQFDYTIDQNLRVVTSNQNKRLSLAYVGDRDTLSVNGDIQLDGNLNLYLEENDGNMTLAGVPNQAQQNTFFINGVLSGAGNLLAQVNRGGATTSTSPVTAYYLLNNDNQNWTGNLQIGVGVLNDHVLHNRAIVRLGHQNALGGAVNGNVTTVSKTITFGGYGRLQLNGIDHIFTGNMLSTGSLRADLGKVENASSNEVTVTLQADSTDSAQDIGVGFSDGVAASQFGGGSAALTLRKTGAGDTVIGGGTTGEIGEGLWSDYTGNTLIEQGKLIAGKNDVFSHKSRHIVSDDATLSLYNEVAFGGFEGTIGSLAGETGSKVDLTQSTLRVGADNTVGADFAGTMFGNANGVHKIGTGSQRLSGDNTVSTGSFAVLEGTLIGASNTAFGAAGQFVYLGGHDVTAISRKDARVELLLEAGATEMVNNVVQSNFNGNTTGLTVVGTRSSGESGFMKGASLNHIFVRNAFLVAEKSDSTFTFGGLIYDPNALVVNPVPTAKFIKIGEGTVRLTDDNVIGAGPFGEGAPTTAGIDGNMVVRHGTLEILAGMGAGSGAIELGDTVKQMAGVALATTQSLKDEKSSFTTDNDGTWSNVKAEVDGVGLTSSDVGKRILVKDELGNAERNGIYVVSAVDSATGRMTLVRADDFDAVGEMTYGSSVTVTEGSQANKSYFMASNDVTVVNDSSTDLTSPVYFEQDYRDSTVSFLIGSLGDAYLQSQIYVYNAIDLNGTNGTGKNIVGGNFTEGASRFVGNITSQNPGNNPANNSRVLTLTSASKDDDGTGAAGTIFEGQIVEAGNTDMAVEVEGQNGGVVTLMGDNQYSGTTTVKNGGNLQVGAMNFLVGQITGTTGRGALTVNSGGVVSGTGRIGGTGIDPGTTHQIFGEIRPGDVGGAAQGTLNVTGHLNLNAGSVANFQVGFGPVINAIDNLGLTASDLVYGLTSEAQSEIIGAESFGMLTPTFGEHDQLQIDGQLTMQSGSVIKLDANGYNNFQVGDVFNLIDWTAGNLAYTPGTVYFDLPDLKTIMDDITLNWDTSLFSSHGILVVVVPEPSKVMLFLIGLTWFATMRRKRQRTA